MKKLLLFILILPLIGFGQSKIRNTQLTSGNQPTGKVLTSDGATNVVWGDAYAGTVSDATTTTKGIIQLAGDLSGTSASPTVVGLSLKENLSNKENTTVNNDTIKYPTVNLLKTYADTKAPASGSGNYIQASPASTQTANEDISGYGKFGNYLQATTAKLTDLTDGYIVYHVSDASGLDNSVLKQTGGAISLFGGAYKGYYFEHYKISSLDATTPTQLLFAQTSSNDWSIQSVEQGVAYKNILLNKDGGNVGIGYSTGTEITNNKLAVNGSIFANGAINTTGYKLNNIDLFGSLSAGNLSKWDGTKFIDEDKTTGTLSGTNVTWDYSIKKNYNITLTGNTVITITNVSDGDVGTLYVTNASTAYTITFAGYVNSIDPDIKLGTNVVETAGGLNEGDYTFKCHGSTLKWNGIVNRTGN